MSHGGSSGTNRLLWYVIGSVVVLSMLVSAGPTIVALANALAPLVLAIAVAVCMLRVVWHFTRGHH